jgi:hypothetical protein
MNLATGLTPSNQLADTRRPLVVLRSILPVLARNWLFRLSEQASSAVTIARMENFVRYLPRRFSSSPYTV